jgi:hypothetical protein
MKQFQLIINILVLIMFVLGIGVVLYGRFGIDQDELGVVASGVLLRGTSGTDFTIDYDNSGAGASSTVTRNRGSTGVIDAIQTWDETNDCFEFNFPLQSTLKLFNQGTGQLTDGSAAGKTVSYMDDSPSGEWTDSEGNGKVVMSDDATYFKMATKSLKMAYAADALVEDGAQYVAGQPYDFSSDENIGFWAYSSIALDGNDLAYELQDDGGEQVILIGAIAATTWTWISLALPGADGDKDAISEMRIVQKVDKGAFDLYVDALFKWDDTEQTALTQNILADGDHSVKADVTAGGAFSMLTRYTDYLIDYGGTDYLVAISDQSANKVSILYTYE